MTKTELMATIDAKAVELVEKRQANSHAEAVALVVKSEPGLYARYRAATLGEPVAKEAPDEETAREFIDKMILERAGEIEKTGVQRGDAIAKAIAEKRALYNLRDHPRLAARPMSEIFPPPPPPAAAAKVIKTPAVTTPAVTKLSQPLAVVLKQVAAVESWGQSVVAMFQKWDAEDGKVSKVTTPVPAIDWHASSSTHVKAMTFNQVLAARRRAA